MKVFQIVEARELERQQACLPRWIIRGRALTDVQLGDVVVFGGSIARVAAIHTYGRNTDLLSGMMSGDIVVEFAAENFGLEPRLVHLTNDRSIVLRS